MKRDYWVEIQCPCSTEYILIRAQEVRKWDNCSITVDDNQITFETFDVVAVHLKEPKR